mmetsp:Transcript_8541/g.31968  ORF Transcript_8541/g.31968 Transcript_8541/m.31968 type:complete len:370 (+) Transcript_8541:3281-4390(+)
MKRTNCVKNVPAFAPSMSGHTFDGERYQCLIRCVDDPSPALATSGFSPQTHSRCNPASAKPTTVWKTPTESTRRFMCVSSRLFFVGALVAFFMSLESRPVKTTKPSAHLVLRNVLPRNSTLSTERGVTFASEEQSSELLFESYALLVSTPATPARPPVIHFPSNLYSWLFGVSHSTRAFFNDCSIDSEDGNEPWHDTLRELFCKPSQAPLRPLRVFTSTPGLDLTFKLVSPSRFAVSTYATFAGSEDASKSKSAGISAPEFTTTKSPTRSSRQVVVVVVSREFWKNSEQWRGAILPPTPPPRLESSRVTTSTPRLFTAASLLCRPKSSPISFTALIARTMSNGPMVVDQCVGLKPGKNTSSCRHPITKK